MRLKPSRMAKGPDRDGEQLNMEKLQKSHESHDKISGSF